MFPISDSIPARRFPFLNLAIIIGTIYVFFQQIIAPNPDSFILKYALIPSQINFNDFSTLTPFVSAIFLHGGFLHIISNMWFLWVFGDNIEGHLGLVLFFILYFLSGIIGNALQYVLMPTSQVPMLGASGAVAGVLGAYFVLFPHSTIKTLVPISIILTTVNIPAGFMLGYWFVLQIISGAATLPFMDGQGGIAFWAHVGGFVTGLIMANAFKRSNSRFIV
ncbi:rhomboid family intramembrane serine protease [Candidatus Roizmanbacteria bacterium]|nr:rhomboid family intramembrane serine protease [Candidatus Roizmanbacteria bacterium]